jgi:hypothetical protein
VPYNIMDDRLNVRSPPTYFRSFKNDVFRLDEGYSEETRSQAGSEMRAESREEMHGMDVEGAPAGYLLPEWTGSLSETERAGRWHTVGRVAIRVVMTYEPDVLESGVVFAHANGEPCQECDAYAITKAAHL